MRSGLFVSSAIAVIIWATPASADVQLDIANGTVSLKATNATVGEILSEWSRVGGTTIVNAEKIGGPPLTLEFRNEPEDRALKTLLRSAGGFVADPRPAFTGGASRFERILLMPAGPPPSRAATPPPPTFAQPQFMPPPIDDEGDDEDVDADEPAPNVVMPAPNGMPIQQPQQMPTPNPRGPVFNTYPPPSPGGPPVSGSGTSPVGSSVPGMVVPAPNQQPGFPDPNRPIPDPEP